MRTLGRAAFMLVASPDFVARHGEPKTPNEIPEFPTVSMTDRPGLDRWALSRPDGEPLEVVHEPRLSASAFPIVREAAVNSPGIDRR